MSEYIELHEWTIVEERHTLDFIKNLEVLMKPEVEEKILEERAEFIRRNRKNPIKFKESQRKYNQSAKGKYAISKKSAIRQKYFRLACESLTKKEKMLIGEFYKNCPEGYEVDHIIPVSKGGKHILSNLQYLTIEDNRRKSNKLIYTCS